MSDKTLLQLPLATTSQGALLYGIQNNEDKAFTPDVLMGSAAAQAANFVYAGPVAPPGDLPSFRRLVVNDIPDLSALYMKTTGGALVSPVITNPTITGGSISGTTIIADDDKWRLRNATDTTKIARFDASAIQAGTTRTFAFPNSSGEFTVNTAPQDLTNKSVYLRASQNTGSTFRIAHGQAPANPVDGDIWTTAGGIYARISGVTVGPLAAEQTSYVTSFNTRVGAITLLPADITSALGYTPWNTNTNLTTSANITAGAITGSTVTDGAGNLRDAINTVNANANNRVAKSGDTMTGALVGTDFAMRNVSTFGAVSSSKIRMFPVSTYTRIDAVNSNSSAFDRMVMGATDYRWEINSGSAATLDSTGNFTVATGSVTSRGPTGGLFFENRANSSQLWAWYSPAPAGNASLNLSGVGNVMTITQGGAVSSTGGFGPGSDPRLKDSTTFRRLDNAIEKVYNLNVTYGKYHDWYNADGKERLFLMADSAMKQSIPQAIISNIVERDGSMYDGWSADQVIALCVKAIQELSDEVANLKEQINELTN